ncbi:lactate utilization protein [Desulfobacterota bacterium AH_259_B03_O07]|nr:lactate utilization protein [Desulfobacterota bacterium AH_259_B03_O07]
MAGNSRDEILKRIRMGLYGSSLNEPGQKAEPEVVESDSLSSIPSASTESLVDLFIEELLKVNGNAMVVKSAGELNEFLEKFVDQRSLKSFSIWESELIRKFKIKELLEGRGLELRPSESKEKLAMVDFGITEADFAISASGTLVLMTSEKKPRSVSLVPPLHIALVGIVN